MGANEGVEDGELLFKGHESVVLSEAGRHGRSACTGTYFSSRVVYGGGRAGGWIRRDANWNWIFQREPGKVGHRRGLGSGEEEGLSALGQMAEEGSEGLGETEVKNSISFI
jgi:hypothetical protein